MPNQIVHRHFGFHFPVHFRCRAKTASSLKTPHALQPVSNARIRPPLLRKASYCSGFRAVLLLSAAYEDRSKLPRMPLTSCRTSRLVPSNSALWRHDGDRYQVAECIHIVAQSQPCCQSQRPNEQFAHRRRIDPSASTCRLIVPATRVKPDMKRTDSGLPRSLKADREPFLREYS